MIFVAIACAAFAVIMGFGTWRLHQASEVAERERYVEGVKLRLIQPNYGKNHPWYPGLPDDILQSQIKLIRAAGADDAFIIFPEAAMPFTLDEEHRLPPALTASISKGQIVITGMDRAQGKGRDLKMWNSLVALAYGGKMVAIYDKAKMTPWGEAVPFRWLIPATWLQPIVSPVDVTSGPGPRTLDLPGLPPFAPMICYEVIFPERGFVDGHLPQWLLAITNDEWLGMSTGPYQHFEMARVRAIEQGLPLMYIGNTGPSASVDPWGRVTASLPFGQEGVLDVKLPKPIAGGTIYGRYGEWFLYLVLGSWVFLSVSQWLRPIKSKSSQPYSW